MGIVNGNSFHGGGLLNFGTVNIINSGFLNKSAFDGGALCNAGGTVNVSGSLFLGNHAPASSGGAIFNSSGKVILTKTRFIENNALNGGAIDNED